MLVTRVMTGKARHFNCKWTEEMLDASCALWPKPELMLSEYIKLVLDKNASLAENVDYCWLSFSLAKMGYNIITKYKGGYPRESMIELLKEVLSLEAIEIDGNI